MSKVPNYWRQGEKGCISIRYARSPGYHQRRSEGNCIHHSECFHNRPKENHTPHPLISCFDRSQHCRGVTCGGLAADGRQAQSDHPDQLGSRYDSEAILKQLSELTGFVGDDVIVHPSVKNEQAKELFPDFKIVKPYLRFTPLPKEETSAAV